MFMTNHKSKPAVVIKVKSGWSTCDCCGTYDFADAHVAVTSGDSTTLLDASYDGHMGGGNWDGRRETLYRWALQRLGIEVWVNGEVLQGLGYASSSYDGICFENLFPEGAPERELHIELRNIDGTLCFDSEPQSIRLLFAELGIDKAWSTPWDLEKDCPAAGAVSLAVEDALEFALGEIAELTLKGDRQ